MSDSKKVSCSWKPDEYEILKRYATNKGLTPGQFLRMAAYQYMERYPQKWMSEPEVKVSS